MPLECGTIVGLENREPDVGKLRSQQRDEIESRNAPVLPEDLAHQALRPVPANRTSYPPRRDDPESASVEVVRKREQSQVTAAHANALPLYAEKLAAPSNPVKRGQGPAQNGSTSPGPPFRGGRSTRPSRDGETLPTLRAPPSQYFPARLRTHPLAEPVCPLAAPVVRLVRAFHALIVSGTGCNGRTRQADIVASTSCSCQRSRRGMGARHHCEMTAPGTVGPAISVPFPATVPLPARAPGGDRASFHESISVVAALLVW